MAASILSKRTLIDKSNSTIVGVTAIAAFVIIFCLVASKSLVSQELYLGRVIAKKKTALTQLKTDKTAANSLVSSYKAFVGTPTNLIGGNPVGNGPQDGDNGTIVLDALPSTYDFPALTTSLAKLIASQGLQVGNITGTDQELAQQANQSSANPQPVSMPFEVTVQGPYGSLVSPTSGVQGLIASFEHSIRPFQIQSFKLDANEGDINADITAETYYQPSKTLSITQEPVQ